MSSNEIIERLIVDASTDPLNPGKNLAIAIEYEKLGQTASAVSFYLRAAEYGYYTDQLIAYASLLRISLCIEGQKNRQMTVSNVLLQAISYMPNRPEAYLLLSRFYERSAIWQESYTFAVLGSAYIDQTEELPVDVSYPGAYSLLFQRGVAAWWIGRQNESYVIMTSLDELSDLNPEYVAAVKANLERMR